MTLKGESYEHEPIDKINWCLNCDLPEHMCLGDGCCPRLKEYNKSRRRRGQLESEVLELIHQGKKYSGICNALGIPKSAAINTVTRLIKKGLLAEEEAKEFGIAYNRRPEDQ